MYTWYTYVCVYIYVFHSLTLNSHQCLKFTPVPPILIRIHRIYSSFTPFCVRSSFFFPDSENPDFYFNTSEIDLSKWPLRVPAPEFAWLSFCKGVWFPRLSPTHIAEGGMTKRKTMWRKVSKSFWLNYPKMEERKAVRVERRKKGRVCILMDK